MVDYKKQGKRNRASGKAFEKRVREDLEKKGWIVSRWQNNVALESDYEAVERQLNLIGTGIDAKPQFKLVPCKPKFNPFTKSLMMNSAGFPDFIVFRLMTSGEFITPYEIVGIECKSGKYLDAEEKEKCKWLIDKKIFSKILIAYKGTKRGQILYMEFKESCCKKKTTEKDL